jgi:hypothetical protein
VGFLRRVQHDNPARLNRRHHDRQNCSIFLLQAAEVPEAEILRTAPKHGFPDDRPLYDSVKGESLKLPDNICFIACCNPFLIKLKKNAEDDIGLVPNEKTSRLSHIVHPVPDRILALVWDFGQLPEEEEKSHILNMVKAEKLFSSLQRGLEIGQINKLTTKEWLD